MTLLRGRCSFTGHRTGRCDRNPRLRPPSPFPRADSLPWLLRLAPRHAPMRAQLSSPCQQVDGALAYFETERSVPAFKLRQNAGRSDIMKGVSGADSDKYFQALRFRQPTSLAHRCPAPAPSRCFHRGCAAPPFVDAPHAAAHRRGCSSSRWRKVGVASIRTWQTATPSRSRSTPSTPPFE